MAGLNSGNQRKADMPKAKLSMANIRKSLFIFTYIRPYKWRFLLALVFLSIGSSLSLAYPWLFGQLMDIAAGNPTKWFGSDPMKVFTVIFALLLIGTVLSYFRITWFAKVGERALSDLRVQLYHKILTLPMDFFGQRRVGELMSRITADLSQIQDTLSTFLANVLRQSIILAAGIAIILITNFKLALIMLGIIPVVVVFALVFGKRIRKLARESQDKLADTGVILEESLQGISSVKAFTNEQFELNRYQKGIGEVVQLAIRNARFRGAFASSVVMFMFGAIALVMYVGITMIGSGELRIGELNSFIFYGMFIAGSMAGFAENYNQLQKTLGATERVREIMDEETESSSGSQIIEPGDLVFKGVEFSYSSRPDVKVLQGINFTIPKGKTVAVVGASGAGKSTLASLIFRFYEIQEGEITLNQTDIRKLDLKAYREKLAIVPQDVLLFGGTIMDNIRYGKPGASDEEVKLAARAANAEIFIEQFPDQYNTIVGDRGMKLSGGQKQRIAIARALLKDPEILILDEATSSLDSESELLIQQALQKLLVNRTSFIIAHRLSTIRNADEIIVLEHGKISEKGKHEDLIQIRDGAYAHFYQLQTESELKVEKY